MTVIDDETLFGWDPTPGIVSVWADHDGQAIVFRRVDGTVCCERERFRPWLLATHLDDLGHLRRGLAHARSRGAANALVQYWELVGDDGSYRYLLTASSGRALSRAI